MNPQLIDAVAECASITKSDARRIIQCFLDAVGGNLKNGQRVQLRGLGTFSITERGARTGRNPQTGAEIKIAAKKVVKFKASSSLGDAIK